MNDAYRAYKDKQKKANRIKKNKTSSPLLNFFMLISSAVFIIYCIYSIIDTNVEIAEKKNELNELNDKILLLELENEEYESILYEDDDRKYKEFIAIENLGYAYPNERRFYDTTRN